MTPSVIFMISIKTLLVAAFAITPFDKFQAMSESREDLITDRVNRYYNSVPYIPDVGDEWKPPSQFVEEGGDCEDYAIAKYYALKERGIRSSIWVVLKNDGAVHALLVTDRWVLDNERDAMQPLSYLGRFSKAYEVDDRGWRR